MQSEFCGELRILLFICFCTLHNNTSNLFFNIASGSKIIRCRNFIVASSSDIGSSVFGLPHVLLLLDTVPLNYIELESNKWRKKIVK